MAKYYITGVWKDDNDTITHYAFHTDKGKSASMGIKESKADAITLLENPNNTAVTWVWNYSNASWRVGEEVTVVDGANGKYLRSNPDDKLTDNLAHLIDFDWIF